MLAGLLTLAAIFGLYHLMSSKTDGNPWKMIPETPALILQANHPLTVYEFLRDDSDIWKSLLRTSEFTKLQLQINKLDTLLKAESIPGDLLWNSPSYIAIYYDSIQQSMKPLFVSAAGQDVNTTKLKKSLSKQLGSDYAVLDIKNTKNGIKIIDGETQHHMFMAFRDGLFVASPDRELLVTAISQYKGNSHFTDEEGFRKLLQTAGKRVDARLFINYFQLSELLSSATHPDMQYAMEWMKQFATWGEADLLLKKDELVLTGYSNSSAPSDFLHQIGAQERIKTDVINVLPFNTNQLIWLGLSDFSPYFDLQNHEAINQRLGIQIQQFIPYINDEIAFASNAQSAAGFESGSWVFFGSKEPEKVIDYLDQLAQLSGSTKTNNHDSYKIRSIKYPDFLANLFGRAFGSIKNNYYTRVGDYVVFANSVDAIKRLLRHYETGKTLDLNENFKSFSDNLSAKSNLLLFIKPRDLASTSERYLNQITARKIQQNENTLTNFQGLAFQYSTQGELAYTNIYLKHNKSYQEENLSLWKVQLDAVIVGKPTMVKDHTTNRYNVLVFDAEASMYLISTDGRILWKKRISGLPVGKIHSVDYYKNRKIQYLFNTTDFVYLIDKNGKHVANYPFKLNPSATNGLNVFDYNKRKDYRILIAQSDKRVYNYNIKGKKVIGWNKPHTRNIVTEPITRLVANNKDYIISTDIDNHINIVNRKGNTRIRLTKEPEKSVNAGYYVNKTNSKGILITTNTQGKLMYISATGGIKYTDFGDFSAQHFFIYEDFNGDGSYDFIYLDGSHLQVFDRFKKLLFAYNFESDITIKPEFINLGRSEKVLGVVADKQKSIFLFDKKGNTVISKGLVGETPFTVGSMYNNIDINLITAAGNTLFNYQIK